MKFKRDDPSSQNWTLTLPGDSTRLSSNWAETLTGAVTTPTPGESAWYCTQDNATGYDLTSHMTLPLCFSASAKQTDSIHCEAEKLPKTLNLDQNLDQNQAPIGMLSSTSKAPCPALRALQQPAAACRTSGRFLDSSVRTLCHTSPAPWELADRHTLTSTPPSTCR